MINVIQDLKQRGILKDVTNWDKLAKMDLNSGVYIGFDPTAESLHLGNYVQIIVLKHFANANQPVVAILGGATGMIGDPSFKAGERALLSQKTLLNNKAQIQKQLESFGLEVFDNLKIYENMNVLTFLREVGKTTNISTMLNRESVSARIENGLSFTEFSYQLIQGWDFKYLYQHKNVMLQVGGSDQWGNIVSGIDIIRKTLGDDNLAVGVTINLLTDAQGNKFGKSTGGGSLWLDPQKTSPFAMYQFLINQSDSEVEKLLKWLTFLPLVEIEKLLESHKTAPFKREAQKVLGFEIVKDIHGITAANNAIAITEKLFSQANDLSALSETDFEQLTTALPFLELTAETTLEAAVLAIAAANSKRELNEFKAQNTFELNGSKIIDWTSKLGSNLFKANFAILRKGKKQYFIFKIK
ncbi:tyrosine--tRNA ligase [Candidatus Mycoplasma pogonae]